MMKTIWRWARWLLVLLLVCALGIFAINGFDEELSPQAKALSAAPPNRYKPEQNMYMALMGMAAPSGESPVAFAQARIAAYEKALAASMKNPSLTGVEETRNPRALAFKGMIDFCQPLTASVWDGIEGHQGEIRRLLDDNRELYQRYIALHALSGYHDVATPSVSTPFEFPSTALRSLFLADFALRMKEGDAAEKKHALADIEADIRAWRVMLRGEGALISKMVAVTYLHADFLMLGDMIADRGIDISDLSPELDRIVTPFDPVDWKIGNAFGYEFRMTLPLLENIDPDAVFDLVNEERLKWWNRYWSRGGEYFFKKHATENLHAAAMQQMIEMANTEPGKLNAARDTYLHWLHENRTPGVRYAYNPIGRILVGVGPALDFYPFHAYDVAAMQRLLKLGHEIRRRGVDPSEIPLFIRQHPEFASHPVSAEPFVWDAKKREIALKPVAPHRKDRRFGLPVWVGILDRPVVASEGSFHG